ncbi:hypothetical protein L0660_13900 [Dyadobacter sp. CY351]|nr:hypothetical protein [Dyadobacter sp. CY351]
MFSNWQLPHYTFIFGVIATLIGLSAAYIQFKKELDDARETNQQNAKRETEFKALLSRYEKLQESSKNIIEKANENSKIQQSINAKQDSALSYAIKQIDVGDQLLQEQAKLINTQITNFQELSGSESIPTIEYEVIDVLDKDFYMLAISIQNSDTLTLRNLQVSIRNTASYISGGAEHTAQIKNGNAFSYEKFLEDLVPKEARSIDIPPRSKIRVCSSTIKFTKNLQKISDIYLSWKGGTLRAEITTSVDEFMPRYLVNHCDIRLHNKARVEDNGKYIIYSTNLGEKQFHQAKMLKRMQSN